MKGRIRPSKPMSALGLIIGIAFVCIGVFVAIPDTGVFGVFWTLVAFIITGYHAFNLFSEHGVADEVVEFDISTQHDSPDSRSEPPERRLAKLDGLKKKGLINDLEYRQQRKRILDDI